MAQNPEAGTHHLNPSKIAQRVYDPINDRIRVDAEVTTSLTGDIEVAVTHLDDSIKIGDGVDFLEVNPDGSINVSLVSSNNFTTISTFNEVPGVVTGVETLLLSYTVPATKTFFLTRVDGSGENISVYNIYLNGSKMAVKRTYFGSNLNISFDFFEIETNGYKLIAGDILEVKALHNRPFSGTFEARIQGLLEI